MLIFSNALNLSKSSVSSISSLIDYSLSLNSLPISESVHAHIVKLGLNRNTFIANRVLSLYSIFHLTKSTDKLFQDIRNKNIFTFNIYISHLCKLGLAEDAHKLFGEMTESDAVTWNSLISGYSFLGLSHKVISVFCNMQESGIRPTKFTLSIVASNVYNPRHAKQVHASAYRNGFSNTVIYNSFVNMYGNVELVEYACRVFKVMNTRDIVSWNSMISIFSNSGKYDLAIECLIGMRNYGFSIDAFTVSTVVCVFTDNRDFEKGEQLLGYCFKMGYISNGIVSSAFIDMYSKCDRLVYSINLFQESEIWDSALCNSVLSAYARNGLVNEALKLFVEILQSGITPTEFTFSSILSSNSCFGLVEQGSQIHCCVIKFGFEKEYIVCSALVDMYTKLGAIECAVTLFASMPTKDLISVNTIILGLAQCGQPMLAMKIFKKMLLNGIQPDRITFYGLLSACSYGGMVDEGFYIFSSMMEKYNIEQGFEHYACIVDMMSRAGYLKEAMHIIETMPHKPNVSIWKLLLEACSIHGDFRLSEAVAEKMMALEPHFSLPYDILIRKYGIRGKWESVARIRKLMNDRAIKKENACSWIGIKDCSFVFDSDNVFHCGGEETYSTLDLLSWEIVNDRYISDQHSGIEDELVLGDIVYCG